VSGNGAETSLSTSSFKMNVIRQELKNTRAVLICVLMVLAFESIYYVMTEPLTGHPWKEPPPDDGMVAAKYTLAESGGHYDIAFVGDSSCLRGIVPSEFSDGSGLAAVNLCTHKMHSIAGFSLMAAKVAKEHPELKAVVIVVIPETLSDSETIVNDYGALGKHLIAYGSEGLGFSPTLSGFRQWFLARHGIRSFPAELGGSYARLVEILKESNGYLPEDPSELFIGSKLPPDFTFASWQFKWLQSLNEQLQKSGQKIFLALSPIPITAASPSFLQSTERAMHEISESLSNVEIIRPRPPRYPDSAFVSTGHVLPEWATKNTLDLIPRAMTALLPQIEGKAKH